MNQQDHIDRLRRDRIIIDMLACVLRNQIQGLPPKKRLNLQEQLLLESAVETTRLEESINHMVERAKNG